MTFSDNVQSEFCKSFNPSKDFTDFIFSNNSISLFRESATKGSLNAWSLLSFAVNSNNLLVSSGFKTLKFEFSGIHFLIFSLRISS